MPHKHTRREHDPSSFDLPPSQIARSLPVNKGRNAQQPSANPKTQNEGVSKKRKNKSDDTPRAFKRLMAFSQGKKLRSGLDDGQPTKQQQKKKKNKAEKTEGSTAQEPETDMPTIRPGERMSDFAARVDAALPLSGLVNKTAKDGKDPAGLKAYRTRKERKMHKLYDQWREEERKIQEKREDEAEEAAERELDEEINGGTFGSFGITRASMIEPGQGAKKKKKGKKGRGVDREEDPWAILKKKRGEVKVGLHDVAQAPPELPKAGRAKLLVDGASVDVSNVPKSAGSLRQREELQQVRDDQSRSRVRFSIVDLPSQYLIKFSNIVNSPKNAKTLRLFFTMSRDLERLIESLITDISCYGDLGCTVSHVLESLSAFYEDAELKTNESAFAPYSSPTKTNQLLWSTAWEWLKARKDISVGANRKWNHLSLSDILIIPDLDSQNAPAPFQAAGAHTRAEAVDELQSKEQNQAAPRKDLPRKRPRIYVSEDRMWESIAGHAPDYRRVPRLEWMALVGIASTKHQGILQGDLGRLVGQDKRSLPKRTDALASKGYISKRTTLVRGTKTSKMWLTHFAPTLPTDPTKAAAGMPSDVDMSREALASDLEPVAWRGRWTGDSVDYISLAQTIMAVVKAYRIIRYHDLRCKLGILGLRWQMKVAAKTCRFFVQTGAIQYVGATLSGRLFKDCLKFSHDLTHEDWAAYLATGKQKSSTFFSSDIGDAELFAADGLGQSDEVADAAANPRSTSRRTSNQKRVSNWFPDKPLTVSVFDNIFAAGAAGLSNKQIGDSTLGPSFRRYLSSISSTLAISTLQPAHTGHFQVLSEMHRKGKSQQYRYFASQDAQNLRPIPAGQNENKAEADNNQVVTEEITDDLSRVFPNPSTLPGTAGAAGGFTALAQGPGKGMNTGTLKRKAEALDFPRAGQPRRGKRARAAVPTYNESPDEDGFSPASIIDATPTPLTRMSTRRGTRGRPQAEVERTSLLVTLKVNPDALSSIMRAQAEKTGGTATNQGSTDSPSGKVLEINTDSVDNRPPDQERAVVADNEKSAIVAHIAPEGTLEVNSLQLLDEAVAEGSPARRGGRRGKRKGTQKKGRDNDRVFKCDQCGGTWKNDIGLKYHVEKSRTTCNPNYVPPPTAPPELVDRLSLPSKTSATARNSRSREESAPAVGRADHTTRLRAPPDDDDPEDANFDPEDGDDHDGSGSASALVPNRSTPSRGRSMRGSRQRWSHPASEARFGARNRSSGQRQPSKPSTLRPPISAIKTSVSGLIDDVAGSVRDMPAEHAPVQPSFKRSRPDETPKANSTYRRGKSCTATAYTDEPSPSTSTAGYQCADQSSSVWRFSEQAGMGPSELSIMNTSAISQADAVRASINANGTDSDLMERILTHILRANSGVFPGGRSVWYAVLATWEVAFPAEPTPAHQSYKDALARLAKRKEVVVSTHAFKDHKGRMANYQLMRTPGVEPGSPAGVAMKAEIIAAHPKPYTPPAFTPKNGLPEEDNKTAQPVFSSRRKLVQGIEVLDAPFYANKAANERPPTPLEGQTPRKRKRRMVTKNQIAHAEDDGVDSTRRKDIFRFFMDGSEGASSGMGRSLSPGMGVFATPLVFLKPNTYLGQDVPEDVRRALLPPEELAPDPTYPEAPAEPAVADDYIPRFTETNVIAGESGTWPAVDDGLFDAEARSLTIRGWMPDSRWFLKQNLPQNMTEMVKYRGRPRAKFPSSSQYAEFCELADGCFDWELSTEGMKLMLAESIAPDYIFINLGVDDLPAEWENPPLDWNSTNQLRSSLLFDERTSDLTTTAADHLWGGDLGRQRRKKRRQKQSRTETRDLVVGIDLKVRTLITLPKDSDLRDASKKNNGLDETNETVLIAAFVATRTLLGGADRVIEWGLMMTLFPDMALSAMRRFWSKARKDRRAFINQLTERFQTRFVHAYENQEFPPIDLDNYIDYDWARLIKWTANLIEDSVELPASKTALAHGYSLASAWADADNWRDDYYNFQMSVFNRFEAATSRPATSLIDGRNESGHDRDANDLVTAMSWLRSLCYTPRDKYAPIDIRKKMASIGGGDEERIQNLLEQAVETLQGQGIITDSKLKALEGRPYRLTETFLPRFKKWTQQQKFIDAARFKSRLDGSFRRGEKIRIPYVLKDGEVMAMMNLQASGRVDVTTVDVPSIPLGFDPGNYESRKYPKSYYNFGLEIAPTDAYVYDEGLGILHQARSNKPPRENQNRAIPLWSDFFGELDIERWSQVLGAVAFVIATRGPLNVPSVCAVLKPYLQEFEVDLVFDWGRRNGVLKGMEYGTSCTVDEWWWLLVGRQRGVQADHS
ncbi:hypothetical protein CkaCkLH20_13056 [Colletotrichum karsti]|uniref:Uncharacterized protein n=1 Tax=Colletotrichum karsti TaxID=1095194 RepID=A0A9P6LCR2_9PEZI|nr:uncharacterized protein CkaCkLH20_13056 [Colletotrichum karsti]KAF9869459.1 hypothetical protein CkaCkLH20_13056 [Colletotrichum karsti]